MYFQDYSAIAFILTIKIDALVHFGYFILEMSSYVMNQ